MRWQLFVDESGTRYEAETLRAPFVVTGLLLPEGLGFSTALRDRVMATHPGVTYPPHRAVLNRPPGMLWAALEARERGGTFPPLALSLVDSLTRAWRDAAPALLVELEERARGSEEPSHELQTALDDALRKRDRTTYDECRAWSDQLRDSLLSIVAALVGGDAHAAIFASGWDVPPHLQRGLSKKTTWAEEQEAYFALLTACVERVALSLSVPLGTEPHSVQVLVAHRPKLEDRRVRHSIKSIEHGAGATPPAVWGGTPLYYDAGAPPALVLADSLANYIRNAYRRERRNWGALRRQLGSGTPCGVLLERGPEWSPQPQPLPSLAATGEPRDWLSQGLHGGVAPPAPHRSVLWDQAELWCSRVRTEVLVFGGAAAPGGAT